MFEEILKQLEEAIKNNDQRQALHCVNELRYIQKTYQVKINAVENERGHFNQHVSAELKKLEDQKEEFYSIKKQVQHDFEAMKRIKDLVSKTYLSAKEMCEKMEEL